jgi:hypothetical protein
MTSYHVIPGRVEDANPESRDSGSGPSDHPGMAMIIPFVMAGRSISAVMPGLVPAIHVFGSAPEKDVDGRTSPAMTNYLEIPGSRWARAPE